jgi:hypothetical protein
LPDELKKSGLGDLQTRINWVWQKEDRGRPEFFSHFEIVCPFNKDRDLIGACHNIIDNGFHL